VNQRPFIPVGENLPNPMKPYSFRCECIADLTMFLAQVVKDVIATNRNLSALFVETDMQFFESIVEFQTNLSLEELQSFMRNVPDAYVALQTLRQLPASQNSFKRDRDIS
jgi:hypothetical protein